MARLKRILVRATNWVGDAVMSLPALAALRRRFPEARISVLARPWVADLYRHEPFADEILSYQVEGWRDRREAARILEAKNFEGALLLQNAFDAALLTWMAGIPKRIGYARDGRSLLLTQAIAVPRKGSIPAHESFYYLELLRQVGWLDVLPNEALIRLEGRHVARQAGKERFASEGIEGPVVGLSPGAAYGNAKRWLPERFAEAAVGVARAIGGHVAIFGSAVEQPLCEAIRAKIVDAGVTASNHAGATTLGSYIELAAACAVYLTNDSGAMHIASALEVPTVAIFGATNDLTTGPTGPLARVVRRHVECSPCLLRECPIDHRCMRAVDTGQVVDAAISLLQRKTGG